MDKSGYSTDFSRDIISNRQNILFSPISIGTMQLKNRIMMAAVTLGMGLNEPRLQAFYTERARGGVEAIITQGTMVEALTKEECWGRVGDLNSFLQTLPRLSDAINQAGAKVGLQLILSAPPPQNVLDDMIAGRTTIYGRVKGVKKGLPPYFLEAQSGRKPLDDLTIDDINNMIEQVAEATVRAKEAGFDFVEYHACHTHFSLLCQAFSPLANHRQDKYGGDLSGRMRLGLECIAAARAMVGSGYTLCYRLPAMEGERDGITLEDAIAYAMELEKVGLDIINVSVGPSCSISPLQKQPMGTYAHLAESIKRHVHIPVVAVGRINTSQVAEAILAEGKADLVAIGRQLIADPFWPKKAAEGRFQEIVRCDSSNHCYGTIGLVSVPPGSSMCKLNPRAGKEESLGR